MTEKVFNRQIIGDQSLRIALHMATKNQLGSPFEKANCWMATKTFCTNLVAIKKRFHHHFKTYDQ
jgi:hypothetical protein